MNHNHQNNENILLRIHENILLQNNEERKCGERENIPWKILWNKFIPDCNWTTAALSVDKRMRHTKSPFLLVLQLASMTCGAFKWFGYSVENDSNDSPFSAFDTFTFTFWEKIVKKTCSMKWKLSRKKVFVRRFRREKKCFVQGKIVEKITEFCTEASTRTGPVVLRFFV